MPSYRHHELGDLYVQIKVNFPTSIDPAVIPLLEQALPARNGMPKLPKKTHIDEVTLEEPNDRQKRSAASNGDEMDEDEDDGRPGVACAQRTPDYTFSENSANVIQSKRGLPCCNSSVGNIAYTRTAEYPFVHRYRRFVSV
jgi:DnaJ-class molecular chaperone